MAACLLLFLFPLFLMPLLFLPAPAYHYTYTPPPRYYVLPVAQPAQPAKAPEAQPAAAPRP